MPSSYFFQSLLAWDWCYSPSSTKQNLNRYRYDAKLSHLVLSLCPGSSLCLSIRWAIRLLPASRRRVCVDCYRFVPIRVWGARRTAACHLKRPCASTVGMADAMSIDNKPKSFHRDESDDSADSSPDRGLAASAIPSSNISSNPIQDVQQPKRKGGRKPVSLMTPPPLTRQRCFHPVLHNHPPVTRFRGTTSCTGSWQ